MKSKLVPDVDTALAGLADGMRLMFGGFGLCGNAEHCIAGIRRLGHRDLTVISNNCGNPGQGLAVLVESGQVRKVVCSFIGGNRDLVQKYLAGDIEVELNPQGTLAERIRAAGAGLGGFYTPTGVGTVIAEGKETREIDGTRYLLEKPLRADFALVRAAISDEWGNARFHRTAQNFNPLMAMAAKTTIVEADRVVPVGALDADDIHLPGIFVQHVFEAREHVNPIEHRTTRPRGPAA